MILRAMTPLTFTLGVAACGAPSPQSKLILDNASATMNEEGDEKKSTSQRAAHSFEELLSDDDMRPWLTVPNSQPSFAAAEDHPIMMGDAFDTTLTYRLDLSSNSNSKLRNLTPRQIFPNGSKWRQIKLILNLCGRHDASEFLRNLQRDVGFDSISVVGFDLYEARLEPGVLRTLPAPTIETLFISEAGMSDEEFIDELVEVLPTFRRLRSLYLNELELDNRVLRAIRDLPIEILSLASSEGITALAMSEVFPLLSKLRLLELAFMHLTDDDFETLRSLPIESLSVRGNQDLSDEVFSYVIQSLPNLRELDASMTHMTDHKLKALMGKQIELLDLEHETRMSEETIIRVLSVLEELTNLNLSGTNVTGNAIPVLSELPIQVLDLSRNKQIGGSALFAQALPRFKQLREANFLGIALTDTSLRALKHLPIEKLNIGLNGPLYDGSLTESAVVEVLPTLRRLRGINLGGIDLKDEGLLALTSLPIEELDISGNKNLSAAGLSKVLPALTMLRKLNVGDTDLTDEKLRTVKGLPIVGLNLGTFSALSKEAVEEVLETLEYLHSFEHSFEHGGNLWGDDEGFQGFFQKLDYRRTILPWLEPLNAKPIQGATFRVGSRHHKAWDESMTHRLNLSEQSKLRHLSVRQLFPPWSSLLQTPLIVDLSGRSDASDVLSHLDHDIGLNALQIVGVELCDNAAMDDVLTVLQRFSLQSLKVQRSVLLEEAFTKFIRALGGLKQLHLDNVGWTDQGSALLTGLPQSMRLPDHALLALEGLTIDDLSLAGNIYLSGPALTKLFASLPNIRSLNLSNMNLTDIGLQACRQLPVHHLILKGNKGLSAETLRQVLSSLLSLRTLNLEDMDLADEHLKALYGLPVEGLTLSGNPRLTKAAVEKATSTLVHIRGVEGQTNEWIRELDGTMN